MLGILYLVLFYLLNHPPNFILHLRFCHCVLSFVNVSFVFLYSIGYHPLMSLTFMLFVMLLRDILKYSSFILLGDFNIDIYNTDHCMMSRLTNFCNTFMLTQMAMESTHTSSNGKQMLIDLVFLSFPHLLKQCSVISPISNSDHNCIHLTVSHYRTTTKPTKKFRKTIWRYK